MTKQEKTALNMAKFIQAQTLLLLEKLNELNLDERADECERLGVSLDIENYCTVSLFFERAYLWQ
jgi:hypothetical protein